MEERIQFAWHIHSYMNEYIRFADAKAGLVIAWTSATIAYFATHGAPSGVWQATLGVLGFLFLLFAFFFAVWAVRPRLETSTDRALIFWEGVRAHRRREIYFQQLASLSAEQQHEAIAHHIYDLSSVAYRKYWWVSLAIIFALIGSVLYGVAIVFRSGLGT